MLLDRQRAKIWQKWVFGFMAVIMVAFLVMIPLSGQLGCGAPTVDEQLAEDIAKYEEALAANPEDVAALRGLGDTYVVSANQKESGSAEQRADLRRAIEYYEKAAVVLAATEGAEARKQRIETLEQVASTFVSLGEYQDAADVYVRITEVTPRDAQAYFDWATLADRAGDTATALLAFTKFLELDPKSPYATDVKQWIEENTPKPTASPSSKKGSGS